MRLITVVGVVALAQLSCAQLFWYDWYPLDNFNNNNNENSRQVFPKKQHGDSYEEEFFHILPIDHPYAPYYIPPWERKQPKKKTPFGKNPYEPLEKYPYGEESSEEYGNYNPRPVGNGNNQPIESHRPTGRPIGNGNSHPIGQNPHQKEEEINPTPYRPHPVKPFKPVDENHKDKKKNKKERKEKKIHKDEKNKKNHKSKDLKDLTDGVLYCICKPKVVRGKVQAFFANLDCSCNGTKVPAATDRKHAKAVDSSSSSESTEELGKGRRKIPEISPGILPGDLNKHRSPPFVPVDKRNPVGIIGKDPLNGRDHRQKENRHETTEKPETEEKKRTWRDLLKELKKKVDEKLPWNKNKNNQHGERPTTPDSKYEQHHRHPIATRQPHILPYHPIITQKPQQQRQNGRHATQEPKEHPHQQPHGGLKQGTKSDETFDRPGKTQPREVGLPRRSHSAEVSGRHNIQEEDCNIDGHVHKSEKASKQIDQIRPVKPRDQPKLESPLKNRENPKVHEFRPTSPAPQNEKRKKSYREIIEEEVAKSRAKDAEAKAKAQESPRSTTVYTMVLKK